MKFAESGTESIGMELEFQLLDKDSLDLVDGILPLMELCSDNQYLTPEFIQNTVEIASKKCFSIAELDTHFHEVTRDLHLNTTELGMLMCTAGTHPFSTRLAHVTPKSRYLKMASAENYRVHTQITFATHVHLGMSSAEDAITMMRAIRPYLPLLLAISSNSPFWHGHDTGYASYRHRVLGSTRSYGMPPAFRSWAEFEEFLDLSINAGLYESVNDIHWDVRPRPNLGTLEIRVMDAQSTVAEAVSRAAFIQALVYYLRDKVSSCDIADRYEYQYWLEKDNLYQASHLGLNAGQTASTAQASIGGDKLVLSKVFEAVLQDVIDFIQSSKKYQNIIELKYLYQLKHQITQPYGYLLQREIYEKKLSFKAVTRSMIDQLADGLV